MLGRRRLRKRRSGFVSFFFLTAFLVLLVQGVSCIEKRLRPALLAIAVIRADGLATDAIFTAVQKTASGIKYQDLVRIEQDGQGRIVMAQLNTAEVNRIMAEAVASTREAIDALASEPILIPLGEALDNYLLAAYGPKIPVHMVPMRRIDARLIDGFEEAGINQTRHKIYLVMEVEVQIIIPFTNRPVPVYATVPIADTVYIGEVPETVINLQFP